MCIHTYTYARTTQREFCPSQVTSLRLNERNTSKPPSAPAGALTLGERAKLTRISEQLIAAESLIRFVCDKSRWSIQLIYWLSPRNGGATDVRRRRRRRQRRPPLPPPLLLLLLLLPPLMCLTFSGTALVSRSIRDENADVRTRRNNRRTTSVFLHSTYRGHNAIDERAWQKLIYPTNLSSR